MKNLKVWQKLALIGLVFLVPLLGVASLLAVKLNEGIVSRSKAISGVNVAGALLDFLHEFQALRAIRHAALRTPGLEAEVARRTAVTRQRLAQFGELAPYQFTAAEWRLMLVRPETMPVHDRPEHTWAQVRMACERYLDRPISGPPLEDLEAANEVVDALLALVGDVGDRSNLTLEPDLDTFYLQNVLLVEGPLAIEQLSRARLLSIGLLWPGEDKEEVVAMVRLLMTVSTPDRERDKPLGSHRLSPVQQERCELAIDKARREPATRESMEELRVQLASVSARARAELLHILDGQVPPVSVETFPGFVEARLGEAYGLKITLESMLRRVLSARMKKLRDDRMLAVCLSALAAFSVGGLGLILMRDITRPIGKLAAVARDIADGKVEGNITLPPREDEIGDLAEALQYMLAEERRQREALVENNVKLLEATERALDADHAKRDFLAAMSHEIRTPLNGILPVADLLADTQMNDAQREYVRTIRTSAEHLLTLVDDVLDFSKIEAGRLELEQVHFELREVLGDSVQTLVARAVARGLELSFHVRPDVPDDLIGDPHRLRQIVVNLIGNALKFTHEGEVNVLVELVSPDPDEVVELRFRVRDTGIGIAPDVVPRLFSAFEQADNSTTRQYGGSGLGLAITKRLVELMGGQIIVESQVDQGSTFVFTARFQLASADYEMTVWNDLPRVKVLSVDDNATNRMIVRDLVSSWGLRIEEASRGAEALVKLRAAHGAGEPFELVITDMMMPDLDGFGLVEQIRADSNLRDVKVMMLTSAPREEDAERIRQLGFAAVMLKPIRQALLMDTIAEIFGRKRRSRHTAPIDPTHIPAQRSLCILLAEDNATNQHVARMNLEAWGHRVIVAGDGVEAVNCFCEGGIDLILMDTQMPNLNGLEATTAIRRREKSGERVPIIAMTANVMKGFREECLAVGMDGYVSKPLRREALVEEMARVVPDLIVEGESPASLDSPATSPPTPVLPPSSAAFDREAFLQSMGGDVSALKHILGITLSEDVPRLTIALEESATSGDPDALEQAAHAIKGLAAELRADPCRIAAAHLEESAKARAGERFPEQIAALRDEFARLVEALR